MIDLELAKAKIKKADEFDWSSCSGCRGDTLCPGVSRRTHLIHPSQAVIYVTADDKTCVSINFQRYIEAFAIHVGIDFIARVPLSEKNALSMGLEDLMDNFF